METNTVPETDQGPTNNPKIWWLVGGAGVLGVCCLGACTVLFALAAMAPLAGRAYSRLNPQPGTPQPGILELIPDVLMSTPTPGAFSYPDAQDNSLGDPNAPLKVVEFVDFQCPYCTRFWDESEKDFIQDYVATGKVYFTIRAVTFIGPESGRAAEAVYCAGEQNKFWEYHDVLFENQGPENSGAFDDDNLTEFAHQAGLDINPFLECMLAGRYTVRVEQDADDARDAGVDASPTFVMNGALLEGAWPYADFVRIIENVLEGNFEDFPNPPPGLDGQNGV